MLVIAAIILAVLSFVAAKAGYKGVSKLFGILGLMTFIGWLASGPGFAILDFFENPSAPDLPDNIPVPGQ